MANSKTTKAYLLIKEKILSGQFAPNTDISEDVLQRLLEMSRTPVREALQILQKEGFVDVYPRKGIIVTDITIGLLNEIFDARFLMEPYIAQKACGNLPRETLLAFRERFLNPPEGLSAAEQAEYYSKLDTEFHASQLPFCPNRFIRDTMRVVADHETRIRRLAFNPQDNDYCVSEHVEMIDHFLEGKTESLAAAVSGHVEHAKRNVFSALFNGGRV